MRRLIAVASCLVALAVTAGAAAATKRIAKSAKQVTIACTTSVGVMVAEGDTGVAPPVAQGTEYGTAHCSGGIGNGVQRDLFRIPESGNTLANVIWYFRGGSISGKYELTPQEGSFNFLQADSTGKLTVTGGGGAYRGVKGAGTIVCHTDDGIHTRCINRLKVKLG